MCFFFFGLEHVDVPTHISAEAQSELTLSLALSGNTTSYGKILHSESTFILGVNVLLTRFDTRSQV